MARQRVPEGPPPAPPVQKLRLRYAKRGRLRFSSTRDFQRALERAVRRAAVPIAFSAGFHPHPRISYTNAAPTGMASEAEYVEISVTQKVNPEAVRAALDEALPNGLDVLDVVVAGPGSLSDRLEASVWQFEYPAAEKAELERAVDAYRALPVAEITRTFKSGPRTFDTRSAVRDLQVIDAPSEEGGHDSSSKCAILRAVVQHTTPAVRPDDILKALHIHVPCELTRSPIATRLAQGPLVGESCEVTDPLTADRDSSGIFCGDASARATAM